MFTDRKDNMEIQAHFILLCFALLHFADAAPFLQIEDMWQPCIIRWWLALLAMKHF